MASKSEVSSSQASAASEIPASSCKRRSGGFFQRKEVWTLTAKGWLLLLAAATALSLTFFFGVHSFLALNDPAPADVMVVEGWIPDFALLQAANEYRLGHYRLLITIGGPFRSGVNLDPDDTYADLAARKLKMFLHSNSIISVPSPKVLRDRTYSGAVAARQWLIAHNKQFKAVNVVTLDVHARRSRMLFERAFGDDVVVGSIAVNDWDYDTRHWWRSSEGLKEVVSESAAYLYERLFFHSSEPLK
ncbi:MAG TPA: ElyC/SanA/YdcF family protein [Verrucomicrobiae bacterium]|jgi:hypothetical protein|nr:ElyC/SanA/YdcF family protein [Verrucomicrobiae bacterium]